jgi:hypothetical protein
MASRKRKKRTHTGSVDSTNTNQLREQLPTLSHAAAAFSEPGNMTSTETNCGIITRIAGEK